MKILKISLYIAVAASLLLLIVAGALPGEYKISRSELVQTPIQVVYGQVINLENWEKWDSWATSDPDADNEYSGPARGLGQQRTWNGKIIGKGSLEIIDAVENESIKTELIFIEPFAMTANGSWLFEQGERGITVTWAMEGKLSYPFERFFGLTMEKNIGPDFENGLIKLKYLSEKMAADTNMPKIEEL